ncbi:cob(I)yrinic acid a,c-diamide adenosyltransferase [bacterium]|nr:cob(I)yrinic acid a,c-diamide adenosyltransferase [bacterium]
MSMRITRVYTRSGDDGHTGLVGGQRVPKTNPRIQAYGTTDELASFIGWARQELAAERDLLKVPADAELIDKLLEYLGNKLFTLGGDLATRIEDRHPMMPVIVDEDIAWLEQVCDRYNEPLPPLKDFILPGGSRTAAALHVARTIARRAEREVLHLQAVEDTAGLPGRYLNRLSDALFVVARWVNHRMGIAEVIWRRDLAVPPLP